MADTVMKIIDVGIAIKEAIETVRSNHRECEGIAQVADQVCGLMRMLQGSAEPMVRHPAVAGVLSSVLGSMRDGLELVISCSKKNVVFQLLQAQSIAKKLARVQREILQNISLGTLAVTVAIASRPQVALEQPRPVHCETRAELDLMLGAVYNGLWVDGIVALLTPETSTTVAFALRAAGAQATYVTGPGNNILCGIGGNGLNKDIFYHIMKGLNFILYGMMHLSGSHLRPRQPFSIEAFCTSLLYDLESLISFVQRINSQERPEIREITDEREELLTGPAVEGAVIACHAKDELDAQLAKGIEAGKLVVINFMSPRCAPSLEIAPVFTECAKEYPTAAVFLEVDIHQLEEVATIYNIQRTPTFVFVRHGVTLETFLGTRPDKLRKTILELIDDDTPSASSSSA